VSLRYSIKGGEEIAAMRMTAVTRRRKMMPFNVATCDMGLRVIDAVIICIGGVTSKLTTLVVVITSMIILYVHFCRDSSGKYIRNWKVLMGCDTCGFDSDSNNDTILQRQNNTNKTRVVLWK